MSSSYTPHPNPAGGQYQQQGHAYRGQQQQSGPPASAGQHQWPPHTPQGQYAQPGPSSQSYSQQAPVQHLHQAPTAPTHERPQQHRSNTAGYDYNAYMAQQQQWAQYQQSQQQQQPYQQQSQSSYQQPTPAQRQQPLVPAPAPAQQQYRHPSQQHPHLAQHPGYSQDPNAQYYQQQQQQQQSQQQQQQPPPQHSYSTQTAAPPSQRTSYPAASPNPAYQPPPAPHHTPPRQQQQYSHPPPASRPTSYHPPSPSASFPPSHVQPTPQAQQQPLHSPYPVGSHLPPNARRSSYHAPSQSASYEPPLAHPQPSAAYQPPLPALSPAPQYTPQPTVSQPQVQPVYAESASYQQQPSSVASRVAALNASSASLQSVPPQAASGRRPLPTSPGGATPPTPGSVVQAPSQSYPNLPASNAPPSAPINTSLPSTPTTGTPQASPTKSSGRPLPQAPGGVASSIPRPSPPITPAATVASPISPQMPTSSFAGLIGDGPVKSFRNRLVLSTPGSSGPPSVLPRTMTEPMGFDQPLPQTAAQQSPAPQRSPTIPAATTSNGSRPLPQPTGVQAVSPSQPALPEQQRAPSPPQQQAPLPARQQAPPQQPPSPAKVVPPVVEDDKPPSSRLTRSPLPTPPTAASPPSVAAAPVSASHRSSQPLQTASAPKSTGPASPTQTAPKKTQPIPRTRPPSTAQPGQRRSRIMQFAIEDETIDTAVPTHGVSFTPSRPTQSHSQPHSQSHPHSHSHSYSYSQSHSRSRIDSDELRDFATPIVGLNLDLDDAPPEPARPLSRNGRRGLPNPPQAAPQIAVSGPPSPPAIAVSAAPAIEVRSPSPAPKVSVTSSPRISVGSDLPSISFSGPSIEVSAPDIAVSAPGIAISEPPGISVSVAEPPKASGSTSSVLKIQLDKPDPGPEETHKPVDVSKLMPIFRGGGLACGGCGRGIVGRVVSAMGVRWHPACFKCSICSELLEHVSAYEYEGRPFCHLDYHENFAPRCYHCKTPIADEQFVTIEDDALPGGRRMYHEHHFFCAECGDPFVEAKMKNRKQDDDVGFTVYKGHPYCEQCHVRLRLPKCKKCRKPLRDHTPAVEALGGKWCWECFTCDRCNKPFDDPSFFNREDKPYCEPCFSILLRNDL